MNIAVAQSGGPTCAINASLLGVFKGAIRSDKIDIVFGSLNGIEGIINDDLIILNDYIKTYLDFEKLRQTPSTVLNSCRYKLPEYTEDVSIYEKIVKNLKAHGIGAFFYIGGNDSMDTVNKLSKYLTEIGSDIKVIGIPKTIDNDLVATDHCPGFGSAAKYIATTFCELERDCNVYDMPAVTIVECMGRNAGWLTAASALSRLNGDRGPSLIYLCEKAFSVERFIEDVKEQLAIHPAVVVAVSEGLKDENGVYISESQQSGAVDVFGHSYIAGAGRFLEEQVRTKIGCKVRSIELNLMQRCASHVASAADIYESRLCLLIS